MIEIDKDKGGVKIEATGAFVQRWNATTKNPVRFVLKLIAPVGNCLTLVCATRSDTLIKQIGSFTKGDIVTVSGRLLKISTKDILIVVD